MIAMRRARFQAGHSTWKKGQKLRADGKLEEALQEFQKAIVADPSSAIALQEMKRTQDMLRTPRDGAKRAGADPGGACARRQPTCRWIRCWGLRN